MQNRSRLYAILCAVFVVLPSLAKATAANPAIPDTPAGHILSAWLTAFDSGDRAKLKAFLQKYDPGKIGSTGELLAFRAETGGFDLRKIESSTPTSLVALVQEHLSDSFAELTLHLQPVAPYHITRSFLRAIDRPAAFPMRHLTQPQLIAALQRRVARETAADRFSGAVLLAKGGKPVFDRAYGLADRARKIPNTTDTRFRIGSMNKMITATATMQLVQGGKVELDKPFGTYLTDYPNKSVSSAVTIRELLTHTGGTGDIFGPQFDKNRLQLRTLQDYINLYGNRPLLFKPGTRWDYSNYGFVLLGAVIEKVSGQSYYDYVHDHIYVPAGMSSTGSEPEDVAVPDRSIGYMMSPALKWVPNTGTLPYRATSAGGGYSTTGDLLHFANALLAHTLLNAGYTQMMMTGKVATPGGGHYGFGFDDHMLNGAHCFGHNGGAPGMNGDLEICPANGYTVVVLSNLDPPAAGRISDFITNRMPK